jgi:hypothetical protein
MLATASDQLSRLVATFRTDRATTSLADLLPAPVVPEAADDAPVEETEAVGL